jgi:hypothetical protein
MGLLRVLNPLVLNPTAPRHRTARAVEALAKAERQRQHDEIHASADRLLAALAEARAAAIAADPSLMTRRERKAARDAAIKATW